jgi:hypothetical protein
MKRFNLAVLTMLAGGVAAGAAEARVYSLDAIQSISFANPSFDFAAPKVALDGDAMIVLVGREGGRSALLYRRGADGRFTLVRTLLDVDGESGFSQAEVTMGSGIAAVKLDDVMHIYERNAQGDWVESETAGTPRPGPGLVTWGGTRFLAGRRCSYDADVYEKSAGSGVWRVVATLTTGLGSADCNHTPSLDLSGDVALIRVAPGADAYEFRRASATSWPRASTLTPPPGAVTAEGAYTLQAGTVVAPGGAVFRQQNGVWSLTSTVQPLNAANGAGSVLSPNLTGTGLYSLDFEFGLQSENPVYVYREAAPGRFEHTAVLQTFGSAGSFAAAGRLAAVGIYDFGNLWVEIFELPPPAPDALAVDFELRSDAEFRQTPGSQFAIANTGANHVYRQSSTVGESRAVFAGEWSTQSYVEADITPTAFDGNDRWFGLGVRYLDDSNFYYVTLRSSNRIQLKRMLNGTFTTLAERELPVSLNRTRNVQLRADGTALAVLVDGALVLWANDATIPRGRSALMTFRTRADFDNVIAGPTLPFNVAQKPFRSTFEAGRPMSETGGSWTYAEAPNGDIEGRAQTSTDGDARAVVGVATGDQIVKARIRLDRSGTSPSGTWFGLLARYVDSRTHYYLSVRSTGELQIRKQVNGAITVLESVPLTTTPGVFREYKLAVIGNQLHAYVDGRFVAGALDGEIPSGQYGFGMYRSAATFQNFDVTQP